MRITDVINRKKKPRKMKPDGQYSPMEEADWEQADELMNDDNGFVNPKKIPDVDQYIRNTTKVKNRNLAKKDK